MLPPAPPTKLFLLEDCLLIREMLSQRCTALPGVEVVGETGLVQEAIALLPQCRPDIMVLDIGLAGPQEDGFVVARFARAHLAATKILVLSGYLTDYTITQCEVLQIEGYLGKSNGGSRVFDAALRAIAAGASYFSPDYLSARQAWLADPRAIAKRLSPRETDVFRLAARGRSDQEIAQDFSVSPSTVTTHRGNILRKLGLPSSTKLMAYAVEHGYGSLQ